MTAADRAPAAPDAASSPSASGPPESLWGPDVLGEREELIGEAERIAHVGTWAWCMRTGRVAWSSGLYRILGRDPATDGATFEAFLESIHEADREGVNQLSQRAASGDVAEHASFRIVRPGGAIRQVFGLAQIFRDPDGVPHRMVGAVMDVTERKLLEQRLVQAQKMEALGRLASGVAHDFNNLLMIIRMNADAVSSGVEPQRDRVEQIQEAAARASALTGQLLAFSRNAPSRRVALDLDGLVAASLGLLRRLAGDAVETAFEPGAEDARVLGDEAQLHQVLLNLTVNGRDAMPDGGRLAIVTSVVSREDDDGSRRAYVRLSVTDTGIGMDAATQARLFEPFFTTKEAGKGTGLGLATVFGVVTQAGGCIEVVSAPGLGSTFHVFLPKA